MHGCELCSGPFDTAGELLAWHARNATQIIRNATGRSGANFNGTVMTWDDMFNPHHNAGDDYFLVNGTLNGSWLGLEPSVTVVNWGAGDASDGKSGLQFFSQRQHSQIFAGYYDSKDGAASARAEWEIAKDPGTTGRRIRGVDAWMYTTWRNDYTQLCEYAETIRNLSRGSAGMKTDDAPNRSVAWWLPVVPEQRPYRNASAVLQALQREGGPAVATSLLLYCSDEIEKAGRFQEGFAPRAACEFLIPRLQAMGIGAERVVGAASISAIRSMCAEPEQSIGAMVNISRRMGLRGISFDLEPAHSTAADAVFLAAYLARLRQALRPNTRVTIYTRSGRSAAKLLNASVLQHSVDRILDGGTYGQCVDYKECVGDPTLQGRWNRSSWLEVYRRDLISPKVAPALEDGASTGRKNRYSNMSIWHCDPTAIAQIAERVSADDVPELALFTFSAQKFADDVHAACQATSSGNRVCHCANLWFPVARKFIGLHATATHSLNNAGAGLKTDDGAWAGRVFSVKAFGAVGDGRTVDSSAVRKAFAACAAAGGGTVVFAAHHRFLSGPFNISSDTTVLIEHNATILGNPDKSDWPIILPLPWMGGGSDYCTCSDFLSSFSRRNLKQALQ